MFNLGMHWRVVRYYPYFTFLPKGMVLSNSFDFYTIPEMDKKRKEFQNGLVKQAKYNGIKASTDNRTAFELANEHNPEMPHLYVVFWDNNVQICVGVSVRKCEYEYKFIDPPLPG